MTEQNKYIESLYTDEKISAEAYLFCLDHKLETIDDVKAFIGCNNSDSVSDKVYEELKKYNEERTLEPSTTQLGLSSITNCTQEEIAKIYLTYKKQTSVRTCNVLAGLESELEFPSKAFFDFLLYNETPQYSFRNLKNAGAKTVSELMSLIENIKSHTDNAIIDKSTTIVIEDKEVEKKQALTQEQECTLDIIFWKTLQGISVRSRNALNSIRKQHNNFTEFYKTISSPDFDIIGQKNVGKGCVADFINVISMLTDALYLVQKEDFGDIKRLLFIESIFGLSEDQAQQICNTVNSKIEYPIFAIINLLIESDDKMRVIANKQISIFNNQTIVDRKEVAGILGITQERVRQLKSTYLQQITEWVDNWQKHINNIHLQYKNAYSLEYDDDAIDEINRSEGVNFNSNFIHTVLYLIQSNDTAIIGDIRQVLLSIRSKENSIYVISKNLYDCFNFDDFINDISKKLHRKVFNSYNINIREHILLFFKGAIEFEQISDILDICRKIIYKSFGLIIQDDILHIEQNAIKNIPDILEDILRTNNRIMSLNELYDEIEYQYPGITKNKISLRGSILRNPNIAAVSRTSNYTLKEWGHTELRGGTIRDIVFDFLNKLDTPQSIEIITEHVLQFRPTTNSDSIYTNMFFDQTKRFSLYEFNGKRVIGLSHKVYSPNYERIEFNESTRRKSFDESFNELEQFITENGRYPFSSGVDAEEERLSRFIGVQTIKMGKGKSSEYETNKLIELNNRYGHLKISKRDYMWNIKFAELEKFVLAETRLPKRSTEFELYTWYYDQSQMLLNGKLNNEQRQNMETLKSLFDNV